MPRAVAPLIIVVAIALAYWPALGGFWGRDDFMQLAFVRLVGSPWPLFVHDHYFPVPGSIFRPLGFASFWFWQAVFGTDYAANAFGDLLLHAGVALALYRVVRAGGIDRVPAAICTLVFALHPAVLGTALWWSARFDLLATLFSLIAVRAAIDYVGRRHALQLVIALTSVLAALLSKEIALAAVVAIGCIWLRWLVTQKSDRVAASRALILLGVVTLVFFAWRTAVLGTISTGLVGDTPLVATIGKGLAEWIGHLYGYVSFWPRLGAVSRIVLALGAIASVVVIVASAIGGARSSRRIDVVLCGLCLFALPALLQAPVVALNAAPLSGDSSAIEAAMQSRLYYLSIGGLVIALSAVVGRALQSPSRWHTALPVALGFVAAAFGVASRETAAAYADASSRPKAMAIAAVEAVDRLPLSESRCHVVLLGVEPPPEWSLYVSMDSVVKALTRSPQRVDRCFIHSDIVTYFHLIGGTTAAADAAPYVDREIHGRRLPWLRIGDAAVAYLDPPPAANATTLDGVVFLRFENGAFRNVTKDVASGALPIELH